MIKYTIDNENKTVTATIDNCANDLAVRLKKIMHIEITGALLKSSMLSNAFSSVAKCHPDDDFDIEKGKLLAKRRVLTKYHTARVKALNRVEYQLNKLDLTVSNEIQKELHNFRKHENDLNEF